jgi:hypothetical protein
MTGSLLRSTLYNSIPSLLVELKAHSAPRFSADRTHKLGNQWFLSIISTSLVVSRSEIEATSGRVTSPAYLSSGGPGQRDPRACNFYLLVISNRDGLRLPGCIELTGREFDPHVRQFAHKMLKVAMEAG